MTDTIRIRFETPVLVTSCKPVEGGWQLNLRPPSGLGLIFTVDGPEDLMLREGDTVYLILEKDPTP